MGITLAKVCAMGGSQVGLVGTIGITLLNSDGSTKTARATANIYEIGGGCYGKDITFDDDWNGSIKWDTGGGSPVYAVEEYDYTNISNLAPANEYDATLSGIQNDLDNPDQYKANISTLALEATASGIKDKTDNLPDDPADQSQIESAITTAEGNIRGADDDDLKDISEQIDIIDIDGDYVETTVSGIQLDMKRVLGLLHENVFIDNTTYDSYNNLISGRVRIYSEAVSVGSVNDVIATYTITVDASNQGKFTSWKQVEA